MKLMAILIAALGLMVLENKADAQIYGSISIGTPGFRGGVGYGYRHRYVRPCTAPVVAAPFYGRRYVRPCPAPVVVAPYGGCYSRPAPRCGRPRGYAYGRGYGGNEYRGNDYNGNGYGGNGYGGNEYRNDNNDYNGNGYRGDGNGGNSY